MNISKGSSNVSGKIETPPTSNGNVNTPLSNSSASPAVSISNSEATGTTSRKSTSPKTRIPRSPTVSQRMKKELSGQTTKMPVSARRRELDKKNQNTLTESALSESEKKHVQRSGTLSDSFEDDVQISKEVSVLDATSEEAISPSRFFSEPKLSVRENHTHTEKSGVNSSVAVAVNQGVPSGFTMLANFILAAIDTQDWGRLDNLINTMREKNFRFDDPALKDSPIADQIRQSAPIATLTANDDSDKVDQETQWILALGLLDLGCDWNAEDSQKNRVIDLLRKQADPSLIAFVVEEFPHLKYLFSKA